MQIVRLFLVVNCFQICIFVLIATTQSSSCTATHRLWIAFKFVSLYWLQQLLIAKRGKWLSCELLSNLYLCTDCNNRLPWNRPAHGVVNCFQICIFVLIATTYCRSSEKRQQLWIAFKFVSLYWLQQRPHFSGMTDIRCELLSNLYLCTDCNNLQISSSKSNRVVNCFQICIFVLIATTLL